MKFNNQSTFNGHQITNVVDRPILHKKGKQWITIGLSTLLLAGLGTVATTGGVHAANIQNNNGNNVNKVNSNNTGDKPTPSNITTKANELHDQILSNEVMYHHSNVGLSKLAMTPKSVSNQSASSSSNSVSNQSSSSNVKASSNSSISSKSSSSVSDNGMTTLNLGNKSEQKRSWNFVQAGINNDDLDNAKASDSNSASTKSSVASGSNSASKVPSNAPINARNSSFNSAYDSYMAQMSGTDSEVASMNKSNANSSSNTANKPLLKNDDNATTQPSDNHWIAEGTMTSDGFGLKTFTPNKYIDSMPATDDISDGTYYGLHFKYDKTLQALEFTSGTPKDDLNKNEIGHLFDNGSEEYSDINNARSIKFDNAVDTSGTTKLTNLGQEPFPNAVVDVVFGTNFDTSKVTVMGDLFSDSLKSITITSPKTELSYKNPPKGHFKHGYLMDGLGIPTMYKVLPEKDASGQNYTLSTPNDFSKGNIGTFVSTPNPKPILYQIDFDDVSNDNSVGTQSITAQKGAIYNVVSDATAKKNGNLKNDIIIPNGYQATNNTPKTITVSQGKTSYISVAPVHQNTNTNSADIPVQGHQITFKGDIILHFQSNNNHDIKDITIPYSTTTRVDDDIKNLLSDGSTKAVVPTDYLNKVIDNFNTNNYSYAHQVNGKSDDGTYYNNVWISPNMAGANDTDAKDKVTGTYNSNNDTYTNPDFQLDFNALDPGDKPSDSNSPSNSHNSDSPLNPNNKRHGEATNPTAKGQIPNSWNPNHSDSPFNPSNTNSPYDPTSPLNPDNPNSPLNPKNDNGNTNPNDPNSQYNPNNPNSILNPKNDNSPLNPSKPDSPLNQKNNPYQPNDTKNNPWNPNTSDSPLNPNNPNSPLNTKNTANPANTTNPNNPNNPLTPSNEKKRGDNNKPSGNNTNDPSDVPTKPSNNGKPSDSDVNINGKSNGKHNPSVPSHVQNPNKPIDNNKTTKGGQSNPNYNPILPDKTSDTKNGTNTTPNKPDDNKDTNGKSTDIPDTPDDVNNTFYITINDFNNNRLVRSYQKRVLEGNTGTSFTLNPSDYTTEGYSMDNADKSYTGYVSANGLTTIDKFTPQSSIVWNYNANSHTVPVHYINQKGKDLTPNATITGNTSDVITPSDELPAGYHVDPGNKPYKFGTNTSDITFNVSGNQLNDNAKATIHLVFNHDGRKYSSRDVTVSLKGKYIGNSDVIVYPVQYQPINDTYHEVPFPENPADIKLDADNFDNSGNYTPSNTFTYDTTTAPSLVIRYVDIDPNAQSVNKGNDSQGRPIIESDSYSAKTLESAPYNLDWVIGNKYTFGLVGSTNKNTVNLIKAPAGYDIVNDASGFNYQNGIETMTLTNGTNYKGHHAMLLMVGLGTTPTHHIQPIHPSSASSTSSSASIPSSSSNVPASSATNSSSSSVVVPNSSSVPSSESTSSESISMNSSEVSTLASEIGANIVIRPSITDKTIDNTQNDTVLDDMASEISINNQEISSLANKQATVSTPTSTSAPTNDVVRTNNNSNDIKPTPTYHINDSHKKAVHYYVYNPTNIILHGKNSSIKISKRRGFTGKIIKVAKVNGKRAYVIRWHHKNYVVNAKKVRNAYIQVKDFNHMAHGLIKHATVKLRKNAMIYSNIHFNKADRITNAKAGSTFTVIGIKKFGEKGYHQTRLVLSNGLIITANRNYVKLI